MFRSVRPYLEEAGIADPVVCYQGAAVVDPRAATSCSTSRSRWRSRAKRSRVLDDAGYPPNCYVDDALDVAEERSTREVYAEFQHLPVSEVGDLVGWLDRRRRSSSRSPIRPSCRRCGSQLARRFGGRLFLTTSLPFLLELGTPPCRRAPGSHSWRTDSGSRRGIVSFGDGENDIELIEWAGFGIAVEDAHDPLLLERADWTCPSAEHEGVAA